jgi:putative protease
MVGGRSGNRGECAQPCRLPYNGGRAVLSLRDLSYADHVTELIESGVASLKIEGRMKSPEYVYTVVSIYRALLDEHRNATARENDRLAKAFSRGGFTDGYLTGKTKDGMTGVRSERDKENSREIEVRTFEPKRVSARAKVEIKLGAPSKMTLSCDTRTVTVFGAEPVAAINAPLDADGVKARLSKMGNTYLSLSAYDIDLTLDDGVNLAPSALNALRRDAAAALQSCKREMPASATPCNENEAKNTTKKRKSAVFYDLSAYFGAIKRRPGITSEFDMVFLPLVKLSDIDTPANGVYLPPIVFDTEWERVAPMLADARSRGVKYALVGNIGHIAPVREAGLIPVGDFRLNVTNALAAREYRDLGVEEMILSAELTTPMARDVGGGVITCGRIPLMITERCFIRDVADCDRCAGNSVTLTDRTGARFPMRREWEHRTLIFNSTITYMGDKREELRRAGLSWEHFIFSSETADEIVDIITRYNKGAPPSGAVRRMGKR